MFKLFKKKPEPTKPKTEVPFDIAPISSLADERYSKFRQEIERMRSHYSGGFIPSAAAISTLDPMHPGSTHILRLELDQLLSTNNTYRTIKDAVQRFQHDVFSDISEGKLTTSVSVSLHMPPDTYELRFQLKIGNEEVIMAETLNFTTSTTPVRFSPGMGYHFDKLMSRVLDSLLHMSMYKAIQNVDTL